MEKWISPREIKSIIILKHETQPCYGEIVTMHKDTFAICYCDGHDFWKNISVGDSIIKSKGSIDLIIVDSLGKRETYRYP
ncbi:MAG: hypothetical protein ACXWDO_06625, partial [Bacteroidia bacterium]